MTRYTEQRYVVVNIETTGLSSARGERIIEIAAVEILGRRVSGAHFYRRINPGCAIDPTAQAVHRISADDLIGQPAFSVIAPEFIAFVLGAEVVMHNAQFDIGFINNELGLLGLDRIERLTAAVVDSLVIARALFPGQANSLAALTTRYQIKPPMDNPRGSLLDAYMLARVYLALTGERYANAELS